MLRKLYASSVYSFLVGNNSDKTGYYMHKFDKNWAKCYNIKIII